MQKYPAIIIDDELDAGQLLKNLLCEFSAISVIDVFTDAVKALDKVILQQIPLVFSDIEMPEITGLEFLKQINQYSPQTKVVFVSAYDNYALKALQNDAFDFLQKPVSREELKRVVYKLIRSYNTNSGERVTTATRLLVKTTDGHHYISTEDLLYLEADANYTYLVMKEDKKLLSSINLGKILDQLPTNEFVRVSRKHAINKNYLSFMNFCKRYCIVADSYKEYRLEVSVKMKELKKELE